MTIDISHLPVELHAHILRLLFFSLHSPSCHPQYIKWPLRDSYRPREYRPEEFPYRVWEEHNLRSTTLFPFNVAYAWDLWRDLVAQMVDYWPRLVLDISKDKNALLTAFDLFKEKLVDGQLDVLVFSSQELEKADENREVGAIVEALEAYVPKCKSITFDLTYASSIPASYLFFLQDAPRLDNLQLKFRVNDVNATSVRGQAVETSGLRPIHLANSFAGLKELYLSGQAFMDLAQYIPTTEWFTSLKPHAIHISHFKFHQNGPYSLLAFLSYISKLSTIRSLWFIDLSLDYDYAGDSYLLPAGYSPPLIVAYHVYFKSVSEAFLENLYAISDITSNRAIYFEDCVIPANVRCDTGDLLSLEKVGNEDGLSPSLCHILKAWGGLEVSFTDCPGLNDKFLSWMSKEVEYGVQNDLFYPLDGPDVAVLEHEVRADERFTYSHGPFKGLPAWEMITLTIRDCDNFSPAALRDMLQTRKDIALRPPPNLEGQDGQAANVIPVQVGNHQAMVSHLTVYGQQLLSEEDKGWFMVKEDELEVFWTTSTGDDPWTAQYEKFVVRQWD